MSEAKKCDVCEVFGESEEMIAVRLANGYFDVCHRCCNLIGFPTVYMREAYEADRMNVVRVFRRLKKCLVEE